MRRYEKYKDSGVEWIGEIPEHWEIKRLKRLAKICNGQDHKNVWDDNGIYPIFGSGGLFGRSSQCLSEGPSVLLGRKGTIDKPQFIEGAFWTVDTAYYTEIKKNINPKLFYYLCTTINFELHKYGSAVPSMTQEVLSQIPFAISFYSPEEQTAIATYLDQKTAEIDALITDKKRLLELYEEEKSAIINEAVTKGLASTRLASTRLASTRLASTSSATLGGVGSKKKKVLEKPEAVEGVRMKDSGIEWMGEIPEHWEVKRLRHVAKVQTGCTPLIQNSEIDYFENGTINWYTPSDFHSNDELKISKRQINKKAVEDGQVILFPEYSIYLVSIGATLGKVSFTKETASANQQINVITFYETMLNPIFGYFFFIANRENIKLEADYTTLPILNQSKAKNLLLACPPVEEQKEIVQYIEAETQRIDTKKERTQKLIDLLTEYRTALISEVVSGKVKVV